jgi:hypothetical protein
LDRVYVGGKEGRSACISLKSLGAKMF